MPPRPGNQTRPHRPRLLVQAPAGALDWGPHSRAHAPAAEGWRVRSPGSNRPPLPGWAARAPSDHREQLVRVRRRDGALRPGSHAPNPDGWSLASPQRGLLHHVLYSAQPPARGRMVSALRIGALPEFSWSRGWKRQPLDLNPPRPYPQLPLPVLLRGLPGLREPEARTVRALCAHRCRPREGGSGKQRAWAPVLGPPESAGAARGPPGLSGTRCG